jgi:hypothetical protein
MSRTDAVVNSIATVGLYPAVPGTLLMQNVIVWHSDQNIDARAQDWLAPSLPKGPEAPGSWSCRVGFERAKGAQSPWELELPRNRL